MFDVFNPRCEKMGAWTRLVTIELGRKDRFQRNLRLELIELVVVYLYVERGEVEESGMIPFWFEQLHKW